MERYENGVKNVILQKNLLRGNEGEELNVENKRKKRNKNKNNKKMRTVRSGRRRGEDEEVSDGERKKMLSCVIHVEFNEQSHRLFYKLSSY
jgi:hypothetical protein